MSKREEVYRLIAQGKNTREIATILDIKLRTAQHYATEYKKVITQDASKTQDASDIKKKKEIAKAYIETGASIREVSELTGTHESTIKKLSSKENLQEKQADFLRRFREEYKARIEENKRRRLQANANNLNVIQSSIEQGEFNRNLQIALLENEKTEQEILELNRLERLEKLEFEKEVYKSKIKLEMLEKIAQMSDTELEELQKYIEQKEQSVKQD